MTSKQRSSKRTPHHIVSSRVPYNALGTTSSELKDRLYALSNQKFKVKAYIPREDRLANKGKSGLKKFAKATKFCPAAIAGDKCKGCSLTGCPTRN